MAEARFQKELDILRSEFKPQSSISFFLNNERALYFQAVTKDKADYSFIGGIGIQAYTIDQVNVLLPGVKERLKTVQGQIAFFGNGFSNAPLTLRERKNIPPPLIVDMFEYPTIYQDYRQLARICERFRLPFHIPWAKQLVDLIEPINDGSLHAVQHFFRKDPQQLPSALHNLHMAINHLGPPDEAFEEQLTTLAPGGELWIWITNSELFKKIPRNFSVQNVRTTGGFVITRKE